MKRHAERGGVIVLAALLSQLLWPAPAAAHTLQGRIESPLPFAAYVLGAAAAVALSFVIVARGRAAPASGPGPGRVRTVPRWLRLGLRGVGLAAWTWVVLQTLLGGSSDAEVASLLLWVFGWVGLPIVSGLLGPVWPWLDPFSSLYDMGVWLARRLGLGEQAVRAYPTALGAWPAVAFMGFFVWLELAARVSGGRSLGVVLIGYTLVTLAGMATFGRGPWRSQAEVFGVWLGVVGRLAPYGLAGRVEEGRVRRRPFGSALVAEPWTVALVALVAAATGSVIYDGLSQTEPFYAAFGIPAIGAETIILGAFVSGLAGLVVLVARRVGLAATGAGLVPVALGYLGAHYLSLLTIEGQRIAVALSDPLQQGWDLLGTAFWEPREDVLPTSLAWGLQVAAIVAGHVAGAWLGHAAIGRRDQDGGPASQWPLAILMVALTSLTLWSLGQNLVFEGSVALLGDIARP